MARQHNATTDLDQYLDSHASERLESLLDLIRIPSISSDPKHADDCRTTADLIAQDMKAIGLENVQLLHTEGLAVVYGDWLHAAHSPTVLVYAHYDVQPADPLHEWNTAPFEPVVTADRIIGRGAADDKGQLHMHLRAAEAWLKCRGSLPVNLKFIFEGEEESGSPHMQACLESNRGLLGADVAVISDTSFFDGNVPALTLSLRGITYLQLDVVGPKSDLHSGVYGGVVRNPANALAHILASLKDVNERVTVEGFYDDVRDLTDTERHALAALPFDEEAYRASLDLPDLIGESGYPVLERRSTRPTLDVNGLWSGFQGEGRKTIIPATAHAKVSCRLVADQRPDEIFRLLREHILRVAPRGVSVDVIDLGGSSPSAVGMDHPAVIAANIAIEYAFGRAPVIKRGSGSIPVAGLFQTVLGLPVVLLGFTQPDCNEHAPNEWLDRANYELGIRAINRYWLELSDVGGSRKA